MGSLPALKKIRVLEDGEEEGEGEEEVAAVAEEEEPVDEVQNVETLKMLK